MDNEADIAAIAQAAIEMAELPNTAALERLAHAAVTLAPSPSPSKRVSGRGKKRARLNLEERAVIHPEELEEDEEAEPLNERNAATLARQEEGTAMHDNVIITKHSITKAFFEDRTNAEQVPEFRNVYFPHTMAGHQIARQGCQVMFVKPMQPATWRNPRQYVNTPFLTATQVMKTIYILCKKFNLPLDEATFVAGSEESYKCQVRFIHVCPHKPLIF